MQRLTPLLAASTLILACTSAYLYQQLMAAHARARSELASERSLREKVAQLEDIREDLETDLRAARRAPSPAEPTAPAAQASGPARGMFAPPPAFMRPPELSAEQQRLMLRHQYRRVFRDLALSDREIDAALDVLTQQAGRKRKQPSASGNPAGDPQAEEAELAAVLGKDKAERFMAEKKLMPVRSEVSLLRMRLEEAGETLSPEQMQAVVEALGNKERAQFPGRAQGDDPQETQERFRTWMQQHNRELRESAAPVLTPKQRELMDEDAVVQESMHPRILHSMTASGAAGTPAPPARGP